MGEFLRDQKTVGEIAVYGGGAILLQFRWRGSTRDVDATVISDGNHGLVREAADRAATVLGMERSWLSEAVSLYTSMEGKRVGPGSFRPLSGHRQARTESGRRKAGVSTGDETRCATTPNSRRPGFRGRETAGGGIGHRVRRFAGESPRAFFPAGSLPERAKLRLPELESAIRRG